MKVVILAGGRGTRLAEETMVRPKPMVEIGGHPILWHIMNIYAAAGFREFVIALGYKGDVIKDYFFNFHVRRSDVAVDLSTGNTEVQNPRGPNWRVHLVDTGDDTQTGGRLLRLRRLLDGETFMATYGDGLARIDVSAVLAFHRRQGTIATLTAVRPPARFGSLEFDGTSKVLRFAEKPQVGEGWINGGFFVFEPAIFSYLEGDQSILEREPLERVCADGQLTAYRLEDFWQPMDTVRERHLLEELWASGEAPWKVWT